MARVSEVYGLRQKQDSLDFVDVDTVGDTKLFIDPQALYRLDNDWSNECMAAIQSFFQRVLDAVVVGDRDEGMALLSQLGEPNDTHLGLSRGQARGNAVGLELADKFWEELSGSDAVKSGLIADLEDTALMIEGVREDRISDVTTNIIRTQLIEYTQQACKYYGIPVSHSLYLGAEWDAVSGKWFTRYNDVPAVDGAPILLVPKSIVRRKLHLDPGEYYRHHVLSSLWHDELAKTSSLGNVVRGRRRPAITKGSVDQKYKDMFHAGRDRPGVEKRINTWFTKRNPNVLNDFKDAKRRSPGSPLSNEDIADATGSDLATIRSHLQKVLETPPGNEHAHSYHRRVEALLSALFYPDLLNPRREQDLHSERKRIDIMYTNAGRSGFFYWLALNYPAANIVVECKNYTRPIGNPEIDQVSGRFSPSRGQVGLLVYRGYVDKGKVRASCTDTAKDQRGWILALDDDDLTRLVEEVESDLDESFGYLHRLFNALNGIGD